ncbi:hypothetical protein F383_25273 [Gossypium arboreum]|uniref:Uncharacterized protein n=1 Tax=Gossypium arboreum TaxID=29729 RepID=A0A0B0P5P3_GOSAR|nr:hypothetical protein F383_25273 [Gossypium arboreum]
MMPVSDRSYTCTYEADACPEHLTLAFIFHVLSWSNHGLFHQFISKRLYSFPEFHPI